MSPVGAASPRGRRGLRRRPSTAARRRRSPARPRATPLGHISASDRPQVAARAPLRRASLRPSGGASTSQLAALTRGRGVDDRVEAVARRTERRARVVADVQVRAQRGRVGRRRRRKRATRSAAWCRRRSRRGTGSRARVARSAPVRRSGPSAVAKVRATRDARVARGHHAAAASSRTPPTARRASSALAGMALARRGRAAAAVDLCARLPSTAARGRVALREHAAPRLRAHLHVCRVTRGVFEVVVRHRVEWLRGLVSPRALHSSSTVNTRVPRAELRGCASGASSRRRLGLVHRFTAGPTATSSRTSTSGPPTR